MADQKAPEPNEDDDLTADLTAAMRGEGQDDSGDESGDAGEDDSGDLPADPDAGLAEPDQARGEETAQETAGSEAAQPLAAPEHWSAADKAQFSKLPADAQKWVTDVRQRIEKRAQERFEGAAEMKREAEEVSTALRPIEGVLKEHNITRGDAIGRFVRAHQLLTADLGAGLTMLTGQYSGQLRGTPKAREIIQQIATELGVGLNAPAAEPGAPPDPARIAEDTVRRILQQHQKQAAEAEEHSIRSAAQAKLDRFREAQDESGNAKHPHYEQIKHVMAAMIVKAAESGNTLSLEDAYAKAVWADEGLRAELIRSQQASDALKAAEARRAHAAKADQARTPRTASAAVVDAPVDQSLEDDLADGYRRIHGRAR